jgi:Amt family ammonium transporter
MCYVAVLIKNAMKWDDALDVWGVHGVGGIIGIIMLGLLGTTAVNSAGANGLFMGEGGGEFFYKQVVAVLGVSIYCFLFTYVMLFVINLITPVRITKEEQEAGVDITLHGEVAYEAE